MSLSNSDNVKTKVKVGICSQLCDGRYMNATDINFLELVSEDVQTFQEKGIQSSVLVFPPFNNYHRFLIHKFVESNFEDLSTFSVGQSSGRRTVVCYKDQLHRQENSIDSTCVNTTISMGVEHHSNTNEDQDAHVITSCSGRKKGFSKITQRFCKFRDNLFDITPSNVLVVIQDEYQFYLALKQGSPLRSRKAGAPEKVRTLPDVPIYRPPALRKSDEGPSTNTLLERKPKPSKQRRPDIAVYVPRALRGTQNTSASIQSSSSRVILKQLSISTEESERNSEEKVLSSSPKITNVSKKKNCSGTQPSALKLGCNEERLNETQQNVSLENSESVIDGDSFPQTSSVIPNHQKEVLEDSVSSSSLPLDSCFHQDGNSCLGSNFSSSPPTSRMEFSSLCKEHSTPNTRVDTQEAKCSGIEICPKKSSKGNEKCEELVIIPKTDNLDMPIEGKFSEVEVNKDSTNSKQMKCSEVEMEVALQKQTLDSKKIGINENETKEEKSEKPPHSTDKVIVLADSSPKRIVKISKENDITVRKKESPSCGQVAVQSNEKDSLNTSNLSDQKHPMSPETNCSTDQISYEMENDEINTSENDEDKVPLASWEELIDLPDDGIKVKKVGEDKKNLPQKLLDEVISSVGKVTVVEKVRSDYTQYRIDGSYALSELSHVVEVYGFPPEFKTQDLISVLSPYGGGNSGTPAFEIKWVDDTHALAVFASSFVVADVLNLRHPMVKTRALEEACAASKAKARKTCESLRIPFRPRPETCAALAQRLITGALGVHHRQSKAEREEERRLLREARERRRTAARERDAAWEGTIGSAL